MKQALEPTDQNPHRSQWRKVTGVVLYSAVEYAGEYYQPVVKYKYEVDGVTYQGDSIVKGLVGVNWRAPAARWVKQFPVGATVPVFVNPKDPRNCYLRLGWDPYFPIAVIFVSLVVGMLLFVFAFGKTA